MSVNQLTQKKSTRKPRGPNPRGPRPQVCDRCYIRKIRCDKITPRCATCVKFNAICSFNRNGASGPLIYQPTNVSISKPKLGLDNGFSFETSFQIQPVTFNKHSPKYNSSSTSTSPTQLVPFRSKSVSHSNITIENFTGVKSKFTANVLKSSLFSEVQSKAFVANNGKCFYMGKSMATFYYTANSHLFSKPNLLDEDNDGVGFKPLILPSEQNISSVSVAMTSTLIQRLVELYFSYLNAFYPIVHAPSFFRLLSRNDTSTEFLALLNAICLSGTSFYPNRVIARVVAVKFSNKFMSHITTLYNKPSLLVIQACTIASYHINLCESDQVINSAWFLLGLAQRMATQLGLHFNYYKFSASIQNPRTRTWWVMSTAETVLGHCFGRPLQYTAINNSKFPNFNQVFSTTVSFVSPEAILAEEYLNFTSIENADFFLGFCEVITLMYKLSRLNLRDIKGVGKASLISILNNDSDANSIKSKPYTSDFFEKYCRFERDVFNSYQRRIKLTDKNIFIIEPTATIHEANLLLNFISLLIDANKPFVSREFQSVNDYYMFDKIFQVLTDPPQIPISQFSKSHSLIKLALCARLVSQLMEQFGDSLTIPAAPIFWYVVLQATFAMLVVLDRMDSNHKAIPPAVAIIKHLDTSLSQHANRWAILKDMYSVSSPLVRRCLSRFSLSS